MCVGLLLLHFNDTIDSGECARANHCVIRHWLVCWLVAGDIQVHDVRIERLDLHADDYCNDYGNEQRE